MTPAQMLAVIEDADAAEPRGRWRIILELRVPVVLGVRGKRLPSDGAGPVFGYTRAKARKIAGIIVAAAQADAGAVHE